MKVLEEITKLINAYNEHYKILSIDRLLDLQDKLACQSYYLAEILGDHKQGYLYAYFTRKIQFSKKTEGLINSKGLSATQAKIEAEALTEKELKDEIEREGQGYKLDIMLKQINKILETIKQRISYLKIELQKTKSQNQT